jgi:hypothetical protein
MADNHTLPAVGDVVASKEKADGAKIQQLLNANFVSANNTTISALGSAATYTGTAEIAPADGVVVSCKADNTGTLYFDFSNDGTNFDTFPSSGFVVASGIHEYHSAKVNGRYFRVRLVNDTGAQTYLRLYTYFGPHTHPSAPLNQNLGSDQDAMVVRPIDPKVDLELGKLGGAQAKAKFGYASGLGIGVTIGTPSSWVDLWSYGGLRTAPSASFTPYVASSSASDTNNVRFEYLDANGVEQEVEVTLTGQTGVSLGVTATDITRGWNPSATDYVGDIACTTANNFTAGVPTNLNEVLVDIPANDGQTQTLAYRIPTGKQAILEHININVIRASGAAGSIIAVLQVKESGGVWRTRLPLECSTSTPVNEEIHGLNIPAGACIRVRIRDVSDALTNVSGVLSYILVDA